MAIDEIQKIEDTQIPKGRIDLVGIGRLGLRISNYTSRLDFYKLQ